MNISYQYIAGFFDGEGCVATYHLHGQTWGVRLVLYQRDKQVLKLIQRQLGCGRLYAPKARPNSYRLTIGKKQDLLRVIPLIYPHSIVKRRQLKLAHRMVKLMGTREWSQGERERLAKEIRTAIKKGGANGISV